MDASADLLSEKALNTKAHILDSALSLFSAKGYNATTMREIATMAGCSLGLTYRYFASKEELLVAFYEKSALDLRTEIDNLPRSTVASRYTTALRRVTQLLSPVRGSFGEMGGVYLNPVGAAGVLSARQAHIRNDGIALISEILSGASDAPPLSMLPDLAMLAYAAYLLLLLFWINDSTPDQSSTMRLLDFVEDMIGRFRILLRLPIFVTYSSRLANIIWPVFGSSEI